MEYDDYNESTSGYVHGDNVDEPLAWLPNYATDRYYYHADGLGSIRALTNSDASLVQVINYDSFGTMLAPEEDPWFEHRYGFAGREYDPDTGLYYNRARYYDTLTGRFISKDPIGFEGQDINLYRYVGNNPVNETDPFGLSPTCGKDDPCKGLKGLLKKAKGKAKVALQIAVLICELVAGESGPKPPHGPPPKPPKHSDPKNPKPPSGPDE